MLPVPLLPTWFAFPHYLYSLKNALILEYSSWMSFIGCLYGDILNNIPNAFYHIIKLALNTFF